MLKIASVVLLLLAFVIVMIVLGIKRKNWKLVVFPIVGFILLVVVMYFGLLLFITSM